MKFYHATTIEAAISIFKDGVIRKGWDGCTYLCKDAKDACKFLAVRGIKNIIIIEVELNQIDVKESYDHSAQFFKCQAYCYYKDIKLTGKEPVFEYTINPNR